MNLVKVEGHAGLARDKNTGAILNINSNEVERIKTLRRNQREIKISQEQEINQLKSDVADIKMMLSKLIEKL